MNKFLKKITKKQLEEILSTFAGREIEIVSDNINLFEDKLVVEFSFISDEYKYIVQKHFLDDFSTLNIYKQTSYIENIDLEKTFKWDDYNKYLFILKMYDIFGKTYLDECPKEAKKEISKLLKSEIEILELDKQETLNRIKNLRNNIVEQILIENKRMLIIDKMISKTKLMKDFLDEDVEEK